MEQKSLIALAAEASRIENMLMESQGEITPEIESAIAIREIVLPEKIDGYSVILDRLAALETFYKERSKLFATAASHLSNAQTNLKERLKYAMQELGVDELKGIDIRYKMMPTAGSLVIDEPELVPLDFKKEVVETVIDRKALKAAVETREIPGARIEPGFSLRMFVNKEVKK